MPTIIPITLERHASLRWQRQANYAFAETQVLAPLVAAELPKAAMVLPTGFIEQSDAFAPVAVLGLQPGNNLFVAADGRWLGTYLPAILRGYPFHLAQTGEGQQVLCIDEESGLVGPGPAGEIFFTADGKPTKEILEILNFLSLIDQSRQATQVACAALKKHRLIQPWLIAIKTASDERQVAGLFRIDEAALNQLSGEALHELVQTGALALAYCQLLSMQHLSVLGQLAQAHARAHAQAAPAPVVPLAPQGDLDLEFLNQGGTINFGALG